MSRPTTPKKYPMHMWAILDRLNTDETTPVILRYPTRNQAKNMQLDFLAFRNACLGDGLEKGKMIQAERKYLTDPLPDPTFLPAMYPDLNSYRTKVRKDEGDAWRLEIFHVDFTDEAKEMRRQLGLDEPEPRTKEVDELKAWLGPNDFDKPSAYAKRPTKPDK